MQTIESSSFDHSGSGVSWVSQVFFVFFGQCLYELWVLVHHLWCSDEALT